MNIGSTGRSYDTHNFAGANFSQKCTTNTLWMCANFNENIMSPIPVAWQKKDSKKKLGSVCASLQKLLKDRPEVCAQPSIWCIVIQTHGTKQKGQGVLAVQS